MSVKGTFSAQEPVLLEPVLHVVVRDDQGDARELVGIGDGPHVPERRGLVDADQPGVEPAFAQNVEVDRRLPAVAEIPGDLPPVPAVDPPDGEVFPGEGEHHREVSPRARSADDQSPVREMLLAPGGAPCGVRDEIGKASRGIHPVIGGGDADAAPGELCENGIGAVAPVAALKSASVEEYEERGGVGALGGIVVEPVRGQGTVGEGAFSHGIHLRCADFSSLYRFP